MNKLKPMRFDIDERLHNHIKVICAFRNETIKAWVIRALIDGVNKQLALDNFELYKDEDK